MKSDLLRHLRRLAPTEASGPQRTRARLLVLAVLGALIVAMAVVPTVAMSRLDLVLHLMFLTLVLALVTGFTALFERLLARVEQSRRHLRLVQEIATAANAARAPETALRTGLAAICDTTGWALGHVLLQEQGEVRSTALWRLPTGAEPGLWQTLDPEGTPRRRAGALARVLETRRPVWTDDIDDDSLLAALARAHDFASLCLVPILVDEEVVGILELLDRTAEPPGDALRRTLAQAGIELGRVLERERAQSERARALRLQHAHGELASLHEAATGSLKAAAHAIRNGLELLDIHRAQLPDTVQRPLDGALDGQRRLEHRLRTLAEYGAADPDRELSTDVDLEEVMASVQDDLGESLRGARLTWDELPSVQGDPGQLHLLFRHLVEDALERHVGGSPSIRIRVLREPDTWHFTVADEGSPVPARALAVGSRPDPGETTLDTAVGLAICRRVLEAHEGSLWIHPHPISGNTVHVHLPA